MSDKDKNQDKLLDHNYDGIQEYDNDLPLWWRNIFVITTVLGIGYAIYMHTGFAESVDDKLAREMSELEAMKPKEDVGVDLLAFVTKPENVEAGKAIYATNCIACHAAQGQGVVGPNLTDPYWIHGGQVNDIHRVIKQGVVEKGMIAWSALLTPDQVKQVTAYVWSIKDLNVPGKAAQGELVEY